MGHTGHVGDHDPVVAGGEHVIENRRLRQGGSRDVVLLQETGQCAVGVQHVTCLVGTVKTAVAQGVEKVGRLGA